MITTREINVDLRKGSKLDRVTTKDVDANPKVKFPKKPIKAKGISTSNIADVSDILEKKRRDDIAKEKKLAMKDKKKITMAEKEVEIITAPAIVKDGEGKPMPTIKEKKPWNKMNAKERKEYQMEKARKKKGA